MADVFCIVNQTVKLSEPTRKFQLPQPLVYQNQLAHKFAATIVNDDGTPAILSDVTVTATMLLANNTTVEDIDGFVDGNVAYALLPPVCYGVAGRFKFNLNLSSNGSTRTILWVDGYVEKTTSNQVTFPEVDEDNLPVVIGEAKAAATLATNAATAANTAAANANTATANAERVNIAQSKTGNIITVTTTNRNGANTDKTITEPTATVSKDQDGPYHITVHDANGTTQAEIPDPAAEVKTKASRSSVSTVKHAIGADGQLTLTDALNEPAKKMTIHLEPKQDLHGYDKPWVGGAGKNLLPMIGNTATWAANANSTYTATDEQLTIVMTDDTSSGVYTRGSSDIGQVIASLNGVYTWSIDLKAAKSVRIVIGIQGTLTITTSVGTDWQRFSGTATFTGARNPFVIYNNGGSGTATTVYARNIMIESGSVATTYEPYSNICPIEGFDSVEVVGTDVNIYDKSQVIYGKNWLNGNSANRAVFVAKTEKGKTLHLRATQHGNTHRIVIVGANKFDSNAVQSFNKNFQPGLSTISYEVTADEYVICQFERYNDAANADVTKEDIDVWNIAISYSEINYVSLNLVSSAGSTVYGGTVTVNEDGSGTLVVDRGIEIINKDSPLGIAKSGSTIWYYNRSIPMIHDVNYVGKMICDSLEVKKNHGEIANSYNTIPCISGYTDNAGAYPNDNRIYFTDGKSTTKEDIVAWLTTNPLTVTFPLSTPTTYTLTASQIDTLLGTNHIWTDGTSIDMDYYADRYADIDKLYAAFPKDTATGNPATFMDGADGLPLEKLEVAIEPKQDLHGYGHPWVGGTGKNLLGGFDDYSVYGITIKDTVNGISISGTFASGQTQFSYTLLNKILPTGTYVVNGVNGAGGSSYQLVITGGGMSGTKYGATNNTTFTSDGTTAVIVRLFVYSSGSPYNVVVPWQIESGTTPTTYEPYSNICPISGFDEIDVASFGANILDISDSSKDFITTLPAGTYTLKRFNSSSDTQINSRIELLINNSYQYIISGEYDDGNIKVVSGDLGWGTSPSQMITTKKEYTLRFLGTTKNALSVHNATLMMVPGTTVPTSYEPYNGQTILPVSLRSISGSTVYGGKLTIKEDGSGELTSEWIYGVLPACSNVGSSGIAGSSGKYGIFNVASLPQLDATQNTVNIIFDSMGSTMLANRGAAWFGYVNDEDNIGCFLPSNYTVEDATAALAGTHFAARLKSPTTYPLTAQQITTLLGTNHISCDAGEVTVTYHADPTMFITKKIAQALNA